LQSLINSLLALFALFGWGVPASLADMLPNPTPTHHVRHHVTHVVATPTPTPTPTPQASPTPTPIPLASAKPKPTPIPTPVTAAPAKLGAAEIASEATCPGQSSVASTGSALTCLTANARVFHGLSATAGNQALMAAATAKDADMAKCGYGHTACGLPFQHEITASGYTGRCYGENIAWGQKTPHDVFVAWMNSPRHRANILNSQYRDLGVAQVAGSNGPLWVMELGGC
jgi:uncharacterized protein YkwD